jgi:hypothetical protein
VKVQLSAEWRIVDETWPEGGEHRVERELTWRAETDEGDVGTGATAVEALLDLDLILREAEK